MADEMLCLLALFALVNPAADNAWPAFRGQGDGIAAVADPPLSWSEVENVAWTAPIEGYGQSSPVVWNGRVFVTATQGAEKESLAVACYDLSSGARRWQRIESAGRKAAVSDYVSRGAPTPAVDDRGVYAFFESGDLHAFDREGRPLWHRNLLDEYGDYQGNHGLGSSPALYGDTLVILVDHDGPSYLLAVDTVTGKNRWKIDRPSKISWSSPIIAFAAGRATVLVSSSGSAEGYDLADGTRRWIYADIQGNTVASPTPAGELVIVPSSDAKQTVALRCGDGEVEAVWHAGEASASFSSPLVYRDCVYLVNKAGVVFCLNLADGKPLWTERLAGSCWASPIAVDDRLYFFGKDGVTTVVAAGAEYRKLSENGLSIDGRVYGVAAVRNAFVLRTGEKLICVGRP